MKKGSLVPGALRVLVLLTALGIVGLGAFVIHTTSDIEARGPNLIANAPLNARQKDAWQAFFDALTEGQLRVWVAIATASATVLTTVLSYIAMYSPLLPNRRWLLIPLDLFSMLALGGAFGVTLSLALKLNHLCDRLKPTPNDDLMMLHLLCPLSKVHAIAAGAATFFALALFVAGVVDCMTTKKQQTCSFEPTASSLGMGHGYQAVMPRVSRGAVPTMYDPEKAASDSEKGTKDRSQGDEEADIGLMSAATGMGRRPSDSTEGGDSSNGSMMGEKEEGKEVAMQGISAPVDVQVTKGYRPARPWSEAPKGRLGVRNP